jgi:hypothetical protein
MVMEEAHQLRHGPRGGALKSTVLGLAGVLTMEI